MAVLDPERPYTPYQRRAVTMKLAQMDGTDLVAASNKFAAMEMENPDGLKKLCDKFDKAPPKNNMKPEADDA
jgi:hypothetical protein